MKKLVALLLGTALVATSVAGLAACGGNKDDNKKPGGLTDAELAALEAGTLTNGPTAKADRKTPTDTRSDAFTGYDHEGTKIGDYKTINDAVNAVVASDKEYFKSDEVAKASAGGWVTPKDGDYKLFSNKKGMTDNYNDQLWIYDGGNKLAGYGSTDSMEVYLKNKKYTSLLVTEWGGVAENFRHGYGMLDAKGQENTDSDLAAQYYELSSGQDASMIMFVPEHAGATGLTYTFDMSGVQITPAYAGSRDKVYAYMGFYLWSGYYVIGTGIACDVNTGNWYLYEGTSRDDSWSDVEYNMGDCIMTSTFDEAKGYFKPDATEVTLSISTLKLFDDPEDENSEYYVADLKVDVKDGASYERYLTGSMINAHFKDQDFVPSTAYMLTMGLDIKAPIATGVYTQPSDFFNGAAFENVKVTKASQHFPTEEELDDIAYGSQITPDLRGKDIDMLLASGTDKPKDAYKYTLLQNYAFTSYKAENGADVYSFSYKGSATDTSLIGGDLKKTQDQIEALSAITAENAKQHREDILAVRTILSYKTLGNAPTEYKYVVDLLDFTTYEAANTIYVANAVTDAAKPVADGFKNISNLKNYPYKGWKAEGEDVAGYFRSELDAFREVLKTYNTLDAADAETIFEAVDRDNWDAWVEADKDMAALEADAKYTGFTLTTRQEGTGDPVELKFENGEDALIEILHWIFKVKGGVKWEGNEGDDTTDPRSTVFNSDHNWLASFHAAFIAQKFIDAGLELPDFVWDCFALVEYTPAKGETKASAFYTDFQFIYHVMEQYARLSALETPTLDKELAEMVNTYMVGVTGFQEAGLAWNFTNDALAGKDFTYRAKEYKQYFLSGEDLSKNLIDYINFILKIVTDNDSNAKLADGGLGVAAAITVPEK